MHYRSTKYHSKKVVTEDGTFDSKKEFNRFCELSLLERAGEITNLERQQKFVLIPTQKKNGKTLERECSYIADFTYKTKDGALVVEDVKGVRTKDYIIKRKLLLFRYGIRIKEV